MDSMQHYIIASSNPSQKDKDRNLKQSLYDASSALLLYRKLRQIVRNGVCISIAQAMLRNADYGKTFEQLSRAVLKKENSVWLEMLHSCRNYN